MKPSEMKCHRCETMMELGFVPDGTDSGSLVQTKWVEGRPQPSTFLGIKTGHINIKARQTYPLTAYRCPTCGSLEFFALPEDAAQEELLRPASGTDATPSHQFLRMSEEPTE